MFSIGFSEVLLLLVVSLVVLGPDKLPGVAEKVGKTLAAVRQQIDKIKSDITP